MKEASFFRLTRPFFASLLILTLVLSLNVYRANAAVTCTQTGYVLDSINLTAALINPASPVTGSLDASSCNIGVYFGHSIRGD